MTEGDPYPQLNLMHSPFKLIPTPVDLQTDKGITEFIHYKFILPTN